MGKSIRRILQTGSILAITFLLFGCGESKKTPIVAPVPEQIPVPSPDSQKQTDQVKDTKRSGGHNRSERNPRNSDGDKQEPKPTPQEPIPGPNPSEPGPNQPTPKDPDTQGPEAGLPVPPPSPMENEELKGASAINLRRLPIPGAQCGDGSPYYLLVDERAFDKTVEERSKKMIFSFQGGGACWDAQTCCTRMDAGENGKGCAGILGADVYSGEKFEVHDVIPKREAVFSTDKQKNNFQDYTQLIFPYCTGDVFLGKHDIEYKSDDGKLEKISHHGRLNVELAMKLLAENKKNFDFEAVSQALVYGYSAGGIGALFHASTVDKYIPNATEKTLITDAPGLTFLPGFWERFSENYFADINDALSLFNYKVSREDGQISDVIADVCKTFDKWRVGVLQGDDDVIMRAFAGMGAEDRHLYKEMIQGPKGFHQVTADAGDNCAAFTITGPAAGWWHTYLTLDVYAKSEAVNYKNMTTMDFAWQFAKSEFSESIIDDLALKPKNETKSLLTSFLSVFKDEDSEVVRRAYYQGKNL